MKDFQLPSRDGCADGSDLSYKNALRHLDCARVIAEAGEYGTAISHLVLAEEEAAKAMILLLYFMGASFPPRVLRTALSKHQPRHGLAAFVSWLASAIQSWSESAASLPPQDDPEYAQMYDRLRQRWVEALGKPRPEKVKRSMSWWVTADVRKQDGLYVNYANGAWISPGDIPKSHYQEAAGRTIAFLSNSLVVLKSLNRIPSERQARWAMELGRFFE